MVNDRLSGNTDKETGEQTNIALQSYFWSTILAGLLEKCYLPELSPSAVQFSWPAVFSRLMTVYSLIDPWWDFVITVVSANISFPKQRDSVRTCTHANRCWHILLSLRKRKQSWSWDSIEKFLSYFTWLSGTTKMFGSWWGLKKLFVVTSSSVSHFTVMWTELKILIKTCWSIYSFVKFIFTQDFQGSKKSTCMSIYITCLLVVILLVGSYFN